MSNLVKALIVDGETLPMHSTYAFELKKVYVEDPERTNTGAIPVFPDKFFVPYFTVTWAVLKIADYHRIMKLIERDENVVTYYDQNSGGYKTAKFYAQQPTYNKLYSMEKQYNMVLNLQIVFAGTLNDLGEVTVEYNANGGLGSISSQSGTNGEEFVINSGATISKVNYVLESWNTQPDGSGDTYKLGDVGVFTYNMTLYAQWVKADSYTLSLSYNYGTPAKDSEGNAIESISVKYNVAIEGLPENVIVLDQNAEEETELIDKDGNKVFTFVGWNKLAQTVGEGTYVRNGYIYDIDGSSVVYAHFDIREYTLTFDSMGGTECEPITAEYLTRISLPKPTKSPEKDANGNIIKRYTFSRWYIIDKGENKVTYAKTTMPYENLTLYAEWKEA